MSGAFRIPSAGRLSQAKTARFSFDGQSYTGIEGDTLASALLANGVHLVGRSFKYHRPRGFLSAGAEEPNALVEVKRDDARKAPNIRTLSVASLIAEAIGRTAAEESVSSLFD